MTLSKTPKIDPDRDGKGDLSKFVAFITQRQEESNIQKKKISRAFKEADTKDMSDIYTCCRENNYPSQKVKMNLLLPSNPVRKDAYKQNKIQLKLTNGYTT